MKTTTHISAIALSLTVLAFCSCQSANVAPLDPFAGTSPQPIAVQDAVPTVFPERTPPPVMAVPAGNVSDNHVPLQTPAVEPPPAFYAPEPTGTRIVHIPFSNDYSGEIVQVAFLDENSLDENGAEPSATAEPNSAGLHDLVLEPGLIELGSVIMTQYRNGHDEFRGPWRPHAGFGHWPQTEYLADGGDDGGRVFIEEDWTVHNLEAEDTVAHFDTLDGRTLVEASNRVHIYAPRFGAVRKVEGLVNSGQITALSGTNSQLALNVDRGREQLGYTAQETQTGYARSRSQLGGVGGRKASTGAGTTQGLGAYSNFEAAMLYSNWLKQRAIGSAELVYLAEGAAGARGWQGTEGVKVRLDTLAPMAATSEEGAESFFQIEEDESKTSKLRLIKVASKKDAQSGETVEFTLRFDNVGNQLIGNVTILDNLTTRLEFLPGTAKSSLKSGFVVEPNDSGSFTLRFEITDPLEPGQFGVVQFQCRVR